MKPSPDMRMTAVANWYGAARMVADKIGPVFDGCPLVVVPFAGGMSELPYIGAAKLLVNDRHHHVINLARVMGDGLLGPQLYRRLRRAVFSEDDLERGRALCCRIDLEASDTSGLFPQNEKFKLWKDANRLDWAEAYAICTWMNRGGRSGADNEFSGALPIRFSPDGGGSAQRFHNWVASIPAWRRVLRKCEFSTDDGIEMLAKVHDSPRVGIYCDCPWVTAGLKYLYPFREQQHRELAGRLGRIEAARVLVRYGDEPLVRELYPPGPKWQWTTYASRSQHNGDVAEVLIMNKPAWESDFANRQKGAA